MHFLWFWLSPQSGPSSARQSALRTLLAWQYTPFPSGIQFEGFSRDHSPSSDSLKSVARFLTSCSGSQQSLAWSSHSVILSLNCSPVVRCVTHSRCGRGSGSFWLGLHLSRWQHSEELISWYLFPSSRESGLQWSPPWLTAAPYWVLSPAWRQQPFRTPSARISGGR